MTPGSQMTATTLVELGVSTLSLPHDRANNFIDFFSLHLATITHFPLAQLRNTTHFHWPYCSQYIKYYRFPNYPPYTDQALLLTLLLSTYQILQISQWPTIHRPSTFVDITTLHISNITDFPIRLCKHQLVI